MRLPTDPRLAPSTDVNLIRLLRDIAKQVNGITEGQQYAFHASMTAAPTTGSYAAGYFVLNSSPALGEYRAWVYGASSFIGVDQIGALKNTTANRPTKTTLGVVNDADWAGYLYLDTTLAAAGRPIWWTGAAWVDATGTAV